MYRSSAARKYGPLATLAAVQLVVVLVAPSTAPFQDDAALTLAPDASQADGTTAAGAEAPGGTGVAHAAPTADADGQPSDTAGPATGAPRTTGPTGSPTTAAAGDTSHCVDGRQFDPAIDYFAPPCVATWTGGDNGGATHQGVYADRIDVVHYIPDYGAEVNAILRAQGLYYNATDASVVNTAFEKFLNEHYEFHGRKLRIITVQGTCRTVPPDLPCLIAEMNKIVATHKPFAVHFNTTVCSACYAELARLKVVSFGGHGFSDEFRADLHPYSWDDKMSSTRMAKLFAEWWCNQMTSRGGAGRTAIFAGGQNALQDFRDDPRVLGVVSTNDPDNEETVRNVLYPELERLCGETVTHEYFYEQNVGTAAQQTQALTAAMNTPQNPATSVVCFCDPVAPQFGQNSFTNNNYWPEQLFASNQSVDTDATGQTYMGRFACPQAERGCQWDGAVGLGQEEHDVPAEEKASMKVFAAASGGATTPLQPPVMDLFWNAYTMFASIVQVTGPNLTPHNMAAMAPRLGSRGGGDSGFSRKAFENGEQSWIRDVRLIYWNKHQDSVYNGEPGRYVRAAQRRFGLGEFPKLSQPPVPPRDQRS